jgi:hypothetical protein
MNDSINGIVRVHKIKKNSFSPLAWTVLGIWAEYMSIRHMGAEYSEKAKNLIDEMRAYSSNCGQKK